jgi:hypothetical protein
MKKKDISQEINEICESKTEPYQRFVDTKLECFRYKEPGVFDIMIKNEYSIILARSIKKGENNGR